jgi:hypothetical protein
MKKDNRIERRVKIIRESNESMVDGKFVGIKTQE